MSTFVGHRNNLSRTLSFLAALGSLVWLVLGFQWFRGMRNVPVLKEPRKSGRINRNPALLVILAARDEERSVNESVVFMAQDHSGTSEIIAVNDRSTDRTGEILDELVARHQGKLRVLSVESLPAGWLPREELKDNVI